MNLQHERITLLCEALSLPCVAQGYGAAAQQAARSELGYSELLPSSPRIPPHPQAVIFRSAATRHLYRNG